MKRQIAAGDLAAADMILSCPWQAHSMAISDLLMSQKRWGRARCRRLLCRSACPRTRPVGTLTERQRLALAACSELEAAPPPPARRSAARPHAVA